MIIIKKPLNYFEATISSLLLYVCEEALQFSSFTSSETMKTYLKFCLIIFLTIPFISYSQEIEIYKDEHTSYYNPNWLQMRLKYNDRFVYKDNFILKSTALYKLKKVNKIEVLNENNVLCWMAEFDTAGNILKKGSLSSNYFITNETVNKNEHGHSLITSYFYNQKLIRVDTTVISLFSFKKADTMINFTRTQVTIYKNGSLINEQNDYYNKLYINKPIKYKPINTYNIIKIKNKLANSFNKKFRTNYDTSTLYKCLIHTYDNDFSSTIDSGKTNIEYKKLRKHPFVKNYRSKDSKKCISDGECFEEPTEFIRINNFRCGTAIYNEMEYSKRISKGYNLNEFGLHESYYNSYRHEDNLIISEKYILYTFKYKYFEQ
ncbi:MAG: hypothetical protein WCI53_10680 [Bacteroidota bacterium]|jgi:hypothetical protein